MRIVFTLLMAMVAVCGLAQQKCASSEYRELQMKLDPAFASRQAAIEAYTSRILHNAREEASQASTIIRIPVIVHIIYKTADQNLSDDQVKSQIAALNRDFRRQNADSINTPARFKDRAADIEIEFALATADPYGRATTGISRRQTNVGDWSMNDQIKFTKSGGEDAWDSKSYLNIWVGSMTGLLGYSSLPGSDPSKDGVVINTTAFGTIKRNAPFDKGRTAVHEVGHWLGLRHIWGDSFCGDDLVDDTPVQGNFTTGCPSTFRSSCNNGSLGDMYMNYMDFTDDACINLFTKGQKTRMLGLFKSGGARQGLLSSRGLSTPWAVSDESPVDTTAKAPRVRIYPNPTNGMITLQLDGDEGWIGSVISITDINGRIMMQVSVRSSEQQINLSSLRQGIYFLRGVNGTKRIESRVVKL